ncbi:unnamed protein product [Dicrocoelium dendriticum]|nr:unnamed protein product [Dicrocoelium dendriticum]
MHNLEELCLSFTGRVLNVACDIKITTFGKANSVLQSGGKAKITVEFKYYGELSSAFVMTTAVVTTPPYQFLLFDSRVDCRRLRTSECQMRRYGNQYLFHHQISISSQWPLTPI